MVIKESLKVPLVMFALITGVAIFMTSMWFFLIPTVITIGSGVLLFVTYLAADLIISDVRGSGSYSMPPYPPPPLGAKHGTVY